MSDFKEIVEYLKFFKKTYSTGNQIVDIVDFNFNEKDSFNNNIDVIRKEDLNTPNYIPLSAMVIPNPDLDFAKIYLRADGNEILYYIRKEFIEAGSQPVVKYLQLPYSTLSDWESINENELVEKTISSAINYYYSLIHNKIILAQSLDNIIVTTPDFIYHPNDLVASDGETLSFNYLDHEGYTDDLSDNFLRLLLDRSGADSMADDNRRSVTLNKKQKPGKVHLFPDIVKGYFGSCALRYNYVEKGIRFNSMFAKRAIKLNFNYYGSLLEFLNQTIFYIFGSLNTFDDGVKALFLDDYMEFVERLLKRSRGNQVLEVLYYVPIFAFKNIDLNFLWNVLDEVLDQAVTNAGLNKDDIVVKILEGLAFGYEHKYNSRNIFLLELVNRKTKNKEPYIKRLQYRIDGENNIKMLQFLHQTWKKSRFTTPNIETNSEFKDTTGPLFLPYESEKWAGFYFSNANVNFKNKNVIVELETGKKIVVPTRTKTEDGVWIDDYKEKEIKDSYTYHPLYPIYIKNVEKQETTIAFESIIPAFLLYANENKAFWQNFVKTGEYVLDALTTLSGIGNLAKLRYLRNVARLAEAAEGVNAATKVAKAVNILRYVKGAAGVVELTSGSVNLMLKITELDETEFGQNLSQVLFYLELITLAGELTASMKNGLKKSAKEVIENSDGATRAKYSELFSELYKISGLKKVYQHIDDFVLTRSKFHDAILVNKLWKEKITNKLLYPTNLKKIYFKPVVHY